MSERPVDRASKQDPAPPRGPGAASERLDERLRHIERRIRLARAVAAATPLLVGLAAGLFCLGAAHRVGAISDLEARAVAILALGVTLATLLVAATRAIEPLGLAVAIDRALGLGGRIAGAHALARDPSPFAALARRDAERHAVRIDARALVPLRATRPLALALGLLAASLALLALPPRPRELATAAPPSAAPTLEGLERPVAIDDDTLRALRERIAARRERAADPEVDEASRELNALIEALSAHAIGERDALERIADLEASLDRRALARAEALRAQLASDARRMRAARSTDALRGALLEGRLEDAARAIDALARAPRAGPPARDLVENLRALAADREREARERALGEAEQEEQRLLERRREREARGEEPPEEEQRLLRERQRELERLRREHEARAELERQLDELRRELGEATSRMERERAGARDEASSTESLERAARSLRSRAREEASAQEMEQLARELERLREAIREAGAREGEGDDREGDEGRRGASERAGEGDERGARMRRFSLRAGGGEDGEGARRVGVAGDEGSPSGDDEGGEPEASARRRREPGVEGGSSGGEGSDGSGSEGSRSGAPRGEPGELLVLGGAGSPDGVLELAGGGDRSGEGRRGDGDEARRASAGPGAGHDPATLEQASARLGGGRQVEVGGEIGEGPTRSQVIRGAASRGFATRDYERVYQDYASYVEGAEERDRVPPGRRAYVERYFELIRPRVGSSEE